MRSLSIVATLLTSIVCHSGIAADVLSGDVDTNRQSLRLRIAADAGRAYDSPLYERLFPITIEMFQAADRRLDVPENLDFTVPVIPASKPIIERQEVIPAGMTIASTGIVLRFQTNYAIPRYNSPLFDGLYPLTIEAFKHADETKDKEVFTFCIANR